MRNHRFVRVWLMILAVTVSVLTGVASELARWGFNEGRGTSSADLSAFNGWTLAMLEGTAGVYPAPKPLWGPAGDTPSGKGYALSLNGSSDYASPELAPLGDYQWTFSALTTISNFSISVWMKSMATNDVWGTLVGHMDAGGYWSGGGWELVNAENGGFAHPIFHYVVDQGTNRYQLDAPGIPGNTTRLSGVWMHVAMTYDSVGGPTNAAIRWYVNGFVVATNRMPKGVFLNDAWHQLNVGVSGANQNRSRGGFFQGLLDEVRIFDEVLTPEQVALLQHDPDVDGRAVDALVHPKAPGMSPSERGKFLKAIQKSKGYRSVKDFKAAGDGREDDTLALQAAINWKRGSVGAKQPAVVFVPAGKYRITGTLVVWDHTQLVGDPDDSPTLFLPRKTVGFDKPVLPKPLMVFASGYDQMPGVLDWKAGEFQAPIFQGAVSHINVWLEQDNPGAIGILVRAGQTNVLHNVTVARVDAAFGIQTDLVERLYLGEAPFITNWLACGAFDAPSPTNSGYHTAYFAEETMAPKAGDESGGIRWEVVKPWELQNDFSGGAFVDFLGRYKGTNNVVEQKVAYAFTYVHAVEPAKCFLLIGADDGYKVWVNGAVAGGEDRSGTARTDDFSLPVTLEKGWNRLLIKVTQGTGDWKVVARLAQADGSRVAVSLNTAVQPD